MKDFSSLKSTQSLSKSDKAEYRKWVSYLKSSKLSGDEIHRRASDFASRKVRVPDE